MIPDIDSVFRPIDIPVPAPSNQSTGSIPIRPFTISRKRLTSLLDYLFYKVSPRDPLAFGSAFAVMAIASLAACFVPAWRKTRTDPARALRD